MRRHPGVKSSRISRRLNELGSVTRGHPLNTPAVHSKHRSETAHELQNTLLIEGDNVAEQSQVDDPSTAKIVDEKLIRVISRATPAEHRQTTRHSLLASFWLHHTYLQNMSYHEHRDHWGSVLYTRVIAIHPDPACVTPLL